MFTLITALCDISALITMFVAFTNFYTWQAHFPETAEKLRGFVKLYKTNSRKTRKWVGGSSPNSVTTVRIGDEQFAWFHTLAW